MSKIRYFSNKFSKIAKRFKKRPSTLDLGDINLRDLAKF